MSPEIPPGGPADWLRHARSDLELARMPLPPRALLEGLCFHAQQAAEKSLKAVLLFRSATFPKTHSIKALLDLLQPLLEVPSEIKAAAVLTDYAVLNRYPGRVEPVDQAEYESAVQLADAVVTWAERAIAYE